MFRKAAQRLGTALFGGSCFLCRGRALEGLLCADCMADLPRTPPEHCPQCALASPGSRICGRCLAHPPQYDATRAALMFRFPADVVVHALKYRGELALASFAAGLLDACIGDSAAVTALVPVPLSGARMRERGYNQSMEIARHLARERGLRLAPELCDRVLDGPAQSGLPFAERAGNVRGAYRCARTLPKGTIAVLDDVMTTGATLEEIAATLKRAGASRVVNWVVARTPPPTDV
jgi:ComF family protein